VPIDFFLELKRHKLPVSIFYSLSRAALAKDEAQLPLDATSRSGRCRACGTPPRPR